MPDYQDFTTIPVGQLGILALPGCEAAAAKIDSYLIKWRKERESEHKFTLPFAGYEKDTYIIKAGFPRFGTGEGKCVINDNCRKCKLCMKLGCPAISIDANGVVKIDASQCNGCGLCMNVCPFSAIEKE